MKRIKLACLFAALALLLGLTACGSSPWQEQYDLGDRYLTEGNYEEAILAFEAAIEIDPRQPEAYLGLAYAYIGQNDFDAAREILERGYELTQDEVLKAKLEELDSGNITDYMGNIRKMSVYDGAGALIYYHTYTYDSYNRQSAVTSFDAAGNQTGHVDITYDDVGNQLVTYAYRGETGELIERVESAFDSDGNTIKEQFYDLATGKLENFSLYQYDEQGQLVREEEYGSDGELSSYSIYTYTYGENSGLREKRWERYKADGSLWDIYVWNYREDGREAGESYLKPNGTPWWSSVYQYDDAGRWISKEVYGEDGTLSIREVYLYDDAGNRIGWEEYDGEGNLTGSTVYN